MNSTKCPNCGLVNFATATECKRCHASFVSGNETDGQPSFAGTDNNVTNPGSSFRVQASSSNGWQATNTGLYYQPSGAITLSGLLAGVAGGLVVGVITAFVYSYIISYIPFVYLNFLCTLGFALALGTTVGGLMKLGKVRNTGVCIVVASVVGLVSYYVSWAVWLSVNVSGEEFSVSSLTLVSSPMLLWQILLKVNELGAWSMWGTTFSGPALWAVWFVETLIVLIGAPTMAWAVLTSDLFCESCQVWCDEDKGVMSLASAELMEMKRRVEAKDFQFLKSIGAKPEDAATWYRLDMHKCPNCNNTNALSLKLETLKVDKDGKASVSTSDFMDKLLLSATEANQLRQLSSELARTQQAA